MSEQIKFGVSPPIHGKFPEDRLDFLKKITLLAEKADFDSIWVEDHFYLPPSEIKACNGEPGKDEPLEAWITLSMIAALSERIRIGTEVTPLTLRHPSILAKMVSTLDVLSKGRVILGAGAGWHKAEFKSFGLTWDERELRFKKTRECIEIIKLLWTEPAVNYKGEFYELDNACLGPKPLQKPFPPIWFGGFSDTILRMIVEYGNGWINATNVSPDFVYDRLNKLKIMAKDSGRDPAEIEVAVPLVAHVSENKETAKSWVEEYIHRGKLKGMLGRHFAEGLRRYGLWGTPRDCISKIQKYTKIGIKYFIFDIRPPSISLDSLSLLIKEVVPHFMRK